MAVMDCATDPHDADIDADLASMYERMRDLMEPSRHPAAILFADVEDSGWLSRRLPTPRYFELIRSLSTRFDSLVAANHGVVGKHAGEGMTAFFLANDDRTPAEAVCSALRTARDLQRRVDEVSQTLNHGLAGRVKINVGLHWGANLYVGQVVPGGRPDVTALGDEVTECARMQESTHGGHICVSKSFAELLSDEDAAGLDVDVEAIVYQPLARLEGVSATAVRDAGTLPVAQI